MYENLCHVPVGRPGNRLAGAAFQKGKYAVEKKESLPTEDTPVIVEWQLKQGATFDTEKKALEQIRAFLCVEQEDLDVERGWTKDPMLPKKYVKLVRRIKDGLPGTVVARLITNPMANIPTDTIIFRPPPV